MTDQFIRARVEIIKGQLSKKHLPSEKESVFFSRKAVDHSKTLRSHRSGVIETHIKGFLSD